MLEHPPPCGVAPLVALTRQSRIQAKWRRTVAALSLLKRYAGLPSGRWKPGAGQRSSAEQSFRSGQNWKVSESGVIVLELRLQWIQPKPAASPAQRNQPW